MMNKCNVIKDILPLYAENMVSEDTKEFVKEHLAECAACRAELEQIKKPAEWKADETTVPLKHLKKKLKIQKIQTILFTAAIVCVFVLSVAAFLTTPQYFPYSDDLVTISEMSDNKIAVSFSDEITDYSYSHSYFSDGDDDIDVYFISTWKTTWDSLFSVRKDQDVILLSSDAPLVVYYTQNNSEDDVLIYGKDLIFNGGVRTLPRTVLAYYLYFALLFFAILVIIFLIFRKRERVRNWIEKILLLPVSYIFGHLLIKGIKLDSYCAQRELFLIILAALVIYYILLSGFYLYRTRKPE